MQVPAAPRSLCCRVRLGSAFSGDRRGLQPTADLSGLHGQAKRTERNQEPGDPPLVFTWCTNRNASLSPFLYRIFSDHVRPGHSSRIIPSWSPLARGLEAVNPFNGQSAVGSVKATQNATSSACVLSRNKLFSSSSPWFPLPLVYPKYCTSTDFSH